MKLTTDNILRLNSYLINLLQECNKNNAEVELATSLTNAITEMNKEDNPNDEELQEMKKYEFSCNIEFYPMVQYIEANTAEEAIELMEQQIEDSAFLQDLTTSDFHCETADIVKVTPEYKAYCDKYKIKLKDK
jgi:hypothetical protein